jgi:uncharacterized membrane protein
MSDMTALIPILIVSTIISAGPLSISMASVLAAKFNTNSAYHSFPAFFIALCVLGYYLLDSLNIELFVIVCLYLVIAALLPIISLRICDSEKRKAISTISYVPIVVSVFIIILALLLGI